MTDNTHDIKSFLATSPSVQQILQYVEDAAQARVKEIEGVGV